MNVLICNDVSDGVDVSSLDHPCFYQYPLRLSLFLHSQLFKLLPAQLFYILLVIRRFANRICAADMLLQRMGRCLCGRWGILKGFRKQ